MDLFFLLNMKGIRTRFKSDVVVVSVGLGLKQISVVEDAEKMKDGVVV